VQTLDQMPTAVRNAEDYLGPDGDIGSMSPEDRGQWYTADDPVTGLPVAGLSGSAGPGLYLTRPANSSASVIFWTFILPNLARVKQVDFGPYSMDHGTDDPRTDPVVFMMGGGGEPAVGVDVTDGAGKYASVSAGARTGRVDSILFGLAGDTGAGGSGFPAQHSAYLGGAVLHVLVDDAPTLTGRGPGDLNPNEVAWTNSTDTVDVSVGADSAGVGVQRLAIFVRDQAGDETLLGDYEDPCDGSLEAPCPAELQHDIALDWSQVPEGRYSLRLRAYDPIGNESEDAYADIGIDRTPPVLDDVQPTVGLQGGDPVLRVDVPQEDPGSSVVSSGVSGVRVLDADATGATYEATTSCVTDDCEQPTDVPLHGDADLDHHLTIEAQDLAGNVATLETTASVSTWAPGGEGD
jgi:hypothetical protein